MKRNLYLLWLFLAAPVILIAQNLKPSDPIPFDPQVKKGTLKNGLTYYIRHNPKPENKVELRLAVKVGSILEEDHEQGLAHFVEHMCFNGTKRFPKNELVDKLQSMGVKFGADLNAYTSFDETVYFLPIPSDDPVKLKTGFEILEDWAFNLTMDNEEIDKERGVISEEYRTGLGADRRMLAEYLPKLLYQSKYADRLPIGTLDIIQNFPHEVIKKFYKDWYRPNLMSVIVVGDIDVNEMEKMIIAHFGKYKNPKNEKPRKSFEVPNHKESFVSIVSDKEQAFSDVQIMYKDYGLPKKTKTVGDFRENLVKSMFSSMINNRLQEKQNSPNPPFNYGYTYHGGTYADTKDAFQSFAMCAADKQLEALKTLLEENERVKKFGFTQGELDRAKQNYLTRMEKQYNERDKNNSDSYVGAYQGHFLNDYPAPGIEWLYQNGKSLVETITLQEVSALINDYIKKDNRVIVLKGPQKEGLTLPTEAEVLALLKMDTSSLTPYEEVKTAESLIRNQPKKGSIVSKSTDSKIDATTLTLSNGAKVTYKKTDFKNDEILFEAVSFGGTNLIDNETFKKVQWAMGGISEAGISGMNKNEMSKFMTGKIASVSASVGGITEGLRGNTTPKDLEYMMQLIYANFTDVNLDPEAYQGYVAKQMSFMGNITQMPSFYFQNELYTYLNEGNPRFNGLVPDAAAWEASDYALAHKLHMERFANASDFHFYFVGNIDEKVFEEHVMNYIASLPDNGKKERPVDLGYRMKKGDIKKVIHKGQDPKSTVSIMYYGDTNYDAKEARAMRALGEVLTIKLIEEVRENESGVYGISARGSISKLPNGSYTFNIGFPCSPDNAENLINSCMREVNKIVDNGPEAKDLNKFLEAERVKFKENLKENRYWMGNFTGSFTLERDPAEILNTIKNLEELTVKDIQNVAKKYLTGDKTIAILMPEEAK